VEKPILKINKLLPPETLEQHIVFEIRKREKIQEKTRFAIFAVISFVSFAGIITALENIVSSATKSGFTKYASLAFSDWSTVMSIWKVFTLSLVETAPIFAVILCVAALLAFVWSVSGALRHAKLTQFSFN
jgi:hypothetical protein